MADRPTAPPTTDLPGVPDGDVPADGDATVAYSSESAALARRPAPPRHHRPGGRHRPAQGGRGPGAAGAGTGQWTVNGRTLEEYFPNKVHQQTANEPFVLIDLSDRFDVVARIHGGGMTGQAGALRLGVARALNEIDEEANRPSLKRAGFLTRDARVKERKKAGPEEGPQGAAVLQALTAGRGSAVRHRRDPRARQPRPHGRDRPRPVGRGRARAR